MAALMALLPGSSSMFLNVSGLNHAITYSYVLLQAASQTHYTQLGYLSQK